MKKFFALAILMALLSTGCSDTASGSSPDEQNLSSCSGNDDEKSSSSFKADNVTDADLLDVDKLLSDVNDTAVAPDGIVYKTMNLGPYVWITKNMYSTAPFSVKSTCYGYDESNCSKHGRLYLDNVDNTPAAICPEGFSIPSAGAWLELAENSSDFTPVFAGVCDKRDTLECENINKSVRYLAADDKSVLFTKDSSGKVSYKVLNNGSNGFYSVRCVKFRSIVEKMVDLPICDTLLENTPSIFVQEKMASYACEPYKQKWVEQSVDGKCLSSEANEFYKINGTLLVCKESKWQVADIRDAGEKCTKDELYKETVLNGDRYACTDSGWIKLKFPASEIGYCREKFYGKVAKASETQTYVCDTTGWRLASIIDMYDSCTDARIDKVVDYNTKKWICSETGWKQGGNVDQERGFCTPKVQDSVVTYDGSYYKCDADDRMWRKEPIDDYLDPCDSTTEGATAMVDTVKYMCYGDHGWFVYDSTLTFIEPMY